jgi:hypothetical protein
LLLIIRGYTSSYAIWSHIKNEVKEKGTTYLKIMAYNNVNKRILNLAKNGLLEDVKTGIGEPSIHGRKDYKLTTNGLEQLTPYVITHPEYAKAIHEYMDRFNVDKQAFGNVLVDNVVSRIDSENEYLISMKSLGFAPTNMKQLRHVQDSLIGFHNKLMGMQNVLFAKKLEKVAKIKTRTGRHVKITDKLIPNYADPYFEQVQQQMERGEVIKSSSELEDTEDFYRKENTRYSTKPVPSPNRSKTNESRKKKH